MLVAAAIPIHPVRPLPRLTLAEALAALNETHNNQIDANEFHRFVSAARSCAAGEWARAMRIAFPSARAVVGTAGANRVDTRAMSAKLSVADTVFGGAVSYGPSGDVRKADCAWRFPDGSMIISVMCRLDIVPAQGWPDSTWERVWYSTDYMPRGITGYRLQVDVQLPATPAVEQPEEAEELQPRREWWPLKLLQAVESEARNAPDRARTRVRLVAQLAKDAPRTE